MLKLHGFAASNYHNAVKMALLEKGITFEECLLYPGKEPELLSKSPMGKMPCVQTEQGFLSESQSIMDYLEDAYPQNPLYPNDAFERAKTRELLRILELYLELPARRLFAEAFFGGKVSEETKEQVKPALVKGVVALKHVAKFTPYLAGNTLTYADCAGLMHLRVVSQASRRIYGEDVLDALPEIKPYLETLRVRASAQKVDKDYAASIQDFMKKMTQRSA